VASATRAARFGRGRHRIEFTITGRGSLWLDDLRLGTPSSTPVRPLPECQRVRIANAAMSDAADAARPASLAAWTADQHATVVRDTQRFRSAPSALRLDLRDQDRVAMIHTVLDRLPLGEATLRLSACGTGSLSFAQIAVWFADQNWNETGNAVLASFGNEIPLDGRWHTRSVPLRLPPRTAVAQLQVIGAGACSLWLDDLELIDVPESDGASPALCRIGNGDFSAIDDDAPAEWKVVQGERNRSAIHADRDAYRSPPAALRLDVRPSDEPTSHGTHVVRVPGERAILRGWAKRAGRLTNAKLAWWVADARWQTLVWQEVVDLTTAIRADGGWHPFEAVIEPQAGAVHGQLQLLGGGEGSVWIDDLELSPMIAADAERP
jgi:hypothetical protein